MSFFSGLLAVFNHRKPVKILCSQQLRHALNRELLRCHRQGVELYTIQLGRSRGLAARCVEAIRSRLTEIDFVGMSEAGDIVIVCPGFDKSQMSTITRDICLACKQNGLPHDFQLVTASTIETCSKLDGGLLEPQSPQVRRATHVPVHAMAERTAEH